MSIPVAWYCRLQELLRGEGGQDLVEYGLLVSLIALAAISSISPLATAVSSMFTSISTSLA